MYRLFAISDLHLPGPGNKPMDVFGREWEDHQEKLALGWMERVGPDDVVLLPGDLSWGMRMAEARKDLMWIADLPGKAKLLVKGNHDYYWSYSLTRMRRELPKPLQPLQGSAVQLDGVTVCGTRLWLTPDDPFWVEERDRNVYNREKRRLASALKQGRRISEDNGTPLVLMTHYPPVTCEGKQSEFLEIVDWHHPEIHVFGHLHRSEEWDAVREGTNGLRTRFVICSADALDFKPLQIMEVRQS
jgi:predicted phosphohydrolase